MALPIHRDAQNDESGDYTGYNAILTEPKSSEIMMMIKLIVVKKIFVKDSQVTGEQEGLPSPIMALLHRVPKPPLFSR